MANGKQMKLAMDDAYRKVAKHGYESDEVTTKDVLLAAIGYLAEINESRGSLVRINGKKMFWAGIITNVVIGAFYAILTLL